MTLPMLWLLAYAQSRPPWGSSPQPRGHGPCARPTQLDAPARPSATVAPIGTILHILPHKLHERYKPTPAIAQFVEHLAADVAAVRWSLDRFRAAGVGCEKARRRARPGLDHGACWSAANLASNGALRLLWGVGRRASAARRQEPVARRQAPGARRQAPGTPEATRAAL